MQLASRVYNNVYRQLARNIQTCTNVYSYKTLVKLCNMGRDIMSRSQTLLLMSDKSDGGSGRYQKTI